MRRTPKVASSRRFLTECGFASSSAACRHLPAVARCSYDQMRPCLRHLLALQQGAHAARDFSSPYLPGEDFNPTATALGVLGSTVCGGEVGRHAL